MKIEIHDIYMEKHSYSNVIKFEVEDEYEEVCVTTSERTVRFPIREIKTVNICSINFKDTSELSQKLKDTVEKNERHTRAY